MWMPPQTTCPPFRTAFSALRNQCADRSEEDGGIELYRRHFVRVSGPATAKRTRQRLRSLVVVAGKGIDLPTLPDADLREDMRGGAKSVQADAARVSGHPQRTPADQAGTHQRRGSNRIVGALERKGEGCIRDHMGGKAAVARIAGEERPVAKVFHIGFAISAASACMSEPWNAHASPGRWVLHSLAAPLDDADNLMAGHDRQLRILQFAGDYMQVGAADGAGLDPHQISPAAGCGSGRSSSFKGWSAACNTIACIRCIRYLRQARYGAGSRAVLALALLLFTGQRRGDVIRMGPQHVRDGAMTVRQGKTGAKRNIPILPSLQMVIDASKIGHLTYLVTEFGKPFSPAGFGNRFRDWCDSAGLVH